MSSINFVFICVGNSCRSQMAEAIAKQLGHGAQSAGTNPTSEIHPLALKVLTDNKISNEIVKALKPQHVDSLKVEANSIVCTMGCGVECSLKPDYDFKLADPKNDGIDVFQKLFEVIERKIRAISLVETMKTDE